MERIKIQLKSKTTSLFPGVSEANRIIKLSTGESHVLALSSEGSLYGFGSNLYGELSLSAATFNTPQLITDKYTSQSSSDKITIMACGENCTMVVTDTGRILFSGVNYNAQMPSARVAYISKVLSVDKSLQEKISSSTESKFRLPIASNAKITIQGGSGNGQLEFYSTNLEVATVDSEGKITPVGTGKTIITVKKLADDNFEDSNSLSFELLVYKPVSGNCSNSGSGIIMVSCLFATLSVFMIKSKEKNIH